MSIAVAKVRCTAIAVAIVRCTAIIAVTAKARQLYHRDADPNGMLILILFLFRSLQSLGGGRGCASNGPAGAVLF